MSLINKEREIERAKNMVFHDCDAQHNEMYRAIITAFLREAESVKGTTEIVSNLRKKVPFHEGNLYEAGYHEALSDVEAYEDMTILLQKMPDVVKDFLDGEEDFGGEKI